MGKMQNKNQSNVLQIDLPTRDDFPRGIESLIQIKKSVEIEVISTTVDEATTNMTKLSSSALMPVKYRCGTAKHNHLCIRPHPFWYQWMLSRRCRKSAVLISGGWSTEGNFQRYYDNLVSYENKLFSIGYKDIHVYYGDESDANILKTSGDLSSSTHVDHVINRLEKIRQSIRERCEIRFPALTRLAVIGSNHGADDEGLCLWGTNEEDQRYYTPSMLQEDLQNCSTSTQIMIIMDQCYSGEFVTGITDPNILNHLCVFSAAHDEEPSYGRQYPDTWEDITIDNNCLADSGPASLDMHYNTCGRSCSGEAKINNGIPTGCTAGTDLLSSTCMHRGKYKTGSSCMSPFAEWNGCPCKALYPWYWWRFISRKWWKHSPIDPIFKQQTSFNANAIIS